MANWTVATLYGRLIDFMNDDGFDGDTVDELFAALEARIVSDQVAGANRRPVKRAKTMVEPSFDDLGITDA